MLEDSGVAVLDEEAVVPLDHGEDRNLALALLAGVEPPRAVLEPDALLALDGR